MLYKLRGLPSEMRNIKKHQFEAAAAVLLSLLAFSLLLDSPFTALSLYSRAPTIASSGSVMYQSSSILLVTDSTPEGPIAYKLDGQLGYETGSSYTLEPGTHIIELPSPYTSPVSSITYYFSNWQDGPTDNPRTRMLEADTTTSLHALYSTSTDPQDNPTPPPPGYLAYTGWEDISKSLSSPWEEGGTRSDLLNQNLGANSITYSTVRSVAGSYSVRSEKGIYAAYDDRIRFRAGDPYMPNAGVECYQSMWIYIEWLATNQAWGGLMSSVRSYSGQNWYTGLEFLGTAPNVYWDFRHAHTPGDADPKWRYYVYSTSYTTAKASTGTVTINPHPVPIGRWFKLEWYLKRSTTDGIYKVWITDPEVGVYDKLLFGLEGDKTWNNMSETGYWQVWYQYGMNSLIYIDELYLYSYNPHTDT